MTVDSEQLTVTTARSRKLLQDITELIEAFNTELEIIGIIETNLPAAGGVQGQEGNHQQGIDRVPAVFSLGDRVRITNRVLTTFPRLPNRQASADRTRDLNTGVIVRITSSRIHIKLDAQPSRTIQRHPSNVAHLI
jgi:hypothetical protein